MPYVTKKEREQREAEWRANEERIARQRALWAQIVATPSTEALRQAMLDRAWLLVNNGQCAEADALLEFLPLADVAALLDEAFPDQAASAQGIVTGTAETSEAQAPGGAERRVEPGPKDAP